MLNIFPENEQFSCLCFENNYPSINTGIKDISSSEVREEIRHHLRKTVSKLKGNIVGEKKKVKRSLRRQNAKQRKTQTDVKKYKNQKHSIQSSEVQRMTKMLTTKTTHKRMKESRQTDPQTSPQSRLSHFRTPWLKQSMNVFPNESSHDIQAQILQPSLNGRILNLFRTSSDFKNQHQKLKFKRRMSKQYTFDNAGINPKEIESVIDENSAQEDRVSEIQIKWDQINRRCSRLLTTHNNSFYRKLELKNKDKL